MKDVKPARKAPARRTSAKTSGTAREKRTAAASGPHQAVVVIHGMGEQRPMDTLRGFVREVWSTDLDLTDPWSGKRTVDPDTGQPLNRSWIVPDHRTGSHELRRITTPYMKGDTRRTDFYEIYWADLMRETPLKRLIGWMKGLLLRPWSDVPGDAVGLYLLAWAVVALAVVPAFALWYAGVFDSALLGIPNWIWAALAWAVSFAVSAFLLPYLGDVADYVRATPDTVAGRAAVRNRGLDLLKTLNDDPNYDRIVLVGHSLGSVIAYDLLQMLWADYGPSHRNGRRDDEVIKLLEAIGKYALPLGKSGKKGIPITGDAERVKYRLLQWKLYALLRSVTAKDQKPWKISDFVTLGSPLTHAEFLIARNDKTLARAFVERLFASCPPISDNEKKSTIIYKDRYAHHASVFAATRWTNIYDLGNLWCTGDPFSGKLEGNFGAGIRDIRVRLKSSYSGLRGRLFTHTFYWTNLAPGKDAPAHIVALRDAVDLARAHEPEKKPA